MMIGWGVLVFFGMVIIVVLLFLFLGLVSLAQLTIGLLQCVIGLFQKLKG